jgi:hypothetical protein
MTQPSVRANIHKPLYICGQFAAQIALNHMVSLKHFPNPADFLFCKIFDPCIRADLSMLQDLIGCRTANTVDVRERNFYPLLAWNVHSCDTSHGALLVLRKAIATSEMRGSIINLDAAYGADCYKSPGPNLDGG